MSGGLGLAAARSARAEDALEVGLRYDAPAACPRADTFVEGVTARTHRVRFVPEKEGAWALVVILNVDAAGASGRILVRERGGRATNQRLFRGANCAEIVDALALVAALAIDPDASTSPLTPPPPVVPPPPPEPEIVMRPVAPPQPAPSTSVRAFVGAAEVGSFGFAPLARGGDVFVGAVFHRSSWPVWMAPELRLAFRGSESVEVGGPSGYVTFSWLGGGIELSPFRVPLGRVVGSVAADLDLGVLRAAGSGPSNARSDARFWGAAGAILRVELPVDARWSFVVGGGPIVPLLRDHFFFGSDTASRTVATIQPVGARLDLAATFRFR